MTMLTQGVSQPMPYSPETPNAAGAGAVEAQRAMVQLAAIKPTIKRYGGHALAMLTLAGVAAAVVALKAAIFFWHLHY